MTTSYALTILAVAVFGSAMFQMVRHKDPVKRLLIVPPTMLLVALLVGIVLLAIDAFEVFPWASRS